MNESQIFRQRPAARTTPDEQARVSGPRPAPGCQLAETIASDAFESASRHRPLGFLEKRAGSLGEREWTRLEDSPDFRLMEQPEVASPLHLAHSMPGHRPATS